MSLETEQCLLGVCLTDPDQAVEIIDRVEPFHFIDDFNRDVYRIAQEWRRAGKPVDPYLIQAEMDLDEYHSNTLYDVASCADDSFINAYIETTIEDWEKRTLEFELATMTHRARQCSTTDELKNLVYGVNATLEGFGEKDAQLTFKEQLRETLKELDEQANRVGIIGMTSGISAIDERIGGLVRKRLMVIAGRPGMGKSVLALITAIASQQEARRENREEQTLIFSLEMPFTEVIKRFISAMKEINFRKMVTPNQLSHSDWDGIQIAVSMLAELNIKIYDGSYSPEKIQSIIRKEHNKMHVQAVFVDHIGLMQFDSKMYRREAIGKSTIAFKNIAKELNIAFVILSQLNRTLEGRVDKRPIISDLSESGNIEQDADYILFVYRDEVYNNETRMKDVAEFITAKNRTGITGIDYVESTLHYQRFNDFNPNQLQSIQERANNNLN